MKYVNKEYGFEGRPPFFKDYREESTKLSIEEKIIKKTSPTAGFGLDKNTLGGALLSGVYNNMWGLKFTYYKNGRWLDEEDFLSGTRYFAGDVKNKFRYICHGDLMASMVKYSKNALTLTFSALHKLKVRLTFYCLTPFESYMRLVEKENKITAYAKEKAVIPGELSLNDNDTVIRSRYEVLYDESSAQNDYAVAVFLSESAPEYRNDGKEIICESVLDEDNPRITVYLAVGDSKIDADIPSDTELIRGINNAELDFSAERIVGSGRLAEYAGEIVSLSASHKIYNPYRLTDYYADVRENVNDYYSFEPLSAAGAGLVSALINDAADDQLITYSGDIILGALSVWIAFCRTRKVKLLAESFPKWLAAWKLDDELITVNPFGKREIGYKMPTSPLKDIRNEKLFSLEFNTYKLLALEIMEKAARILGRPEKEELPELYRIFKNKFKDMFFNEKAGVFADRYESGEFSHNTGITSFLPILCGAADTNDMLDKLLINLKDNKKYGLPAPSLSKDHPLYGKKSVKTDGKTRYKYEDYRGSIPAYFNYLLYLGLVRAGANDFTAELALSSVKYWKTYFEKYGYVPSIVLPNNKLDASATRKAVSGNLFGLIGISELLDVEYFNDDLRPSVRFGTFAQGTNRIANMTVLGKRADITVSKGVTTLRLDGKTAVEGVGGEFIVRHFKENADGAEFLIYTKANVKFTIKLPLFVSDGAEKASHVFNIETGKFRVKIINADGEFRIKQERL